MTANSLKKVREAAIDGRMHNPFFRKVQLHNLHRKLSENATQIQEALAADVEDGHRPEEIKAEFCLALQNLGDHYEALDVGRVLDNEYALANGKDAPSSSDPVGIVVIEPASHTFFFGLLSAVVPALATGNCIIIQSQQTMLHAPRLILQLLVDSLDQDIIYVSTTTITESDIGHRHVRVLQQGRSSEARHSQLSTHIVSQPDSRTLAIVERDTDIAAAANALVAARFSLGARSPYAPDIVLVNEWIQRDFLHAVTQSASRFAIDIVSLNGRDERAKSNTKVLSDRVAEDGSASIVSFASHGAVLSLKDRNSALLKRKLGIPCFNVLPVTSMDDAIDFAKQFGRLSAVSVFTASNDAAKYICQFLDTDLALVNQFPTSLLFGPVAPRGHVFTRNLWTSRYDLSLFTLPKPGYITRPKNTAILDDIIAGTARTAQAHLQLQMWESKVIAVLPELKRPEKGGDIGFFNQGIVTGGILLLSSILAGLGSFVYYTVKYAKTIQL